VTVGRLPAWPTAAALSGLPSALAWPFGRSDPIGATREIGRFVLGRPSVAAGAVGQLGFALLFSVPGPRLAGSRRAGVAGALYGLALYRVNFGLIAPRRWPAIVRHGGVVQASDHAPVRRHARRRPAASCVTPDRRGPAMRAADGSTPSLL